MAPFEKLSHEASQRNENRSSNYAPVSSVDPRPITCFNQENLRNYERSSVIKSERNKG